MTQAQGYQAGGTPAQALIGDYCTERDRRLAYWYMQLRMRKGRAAKERAKVMIIKLGGEL